MPAELMPFAFASGSLAMFNVEKVWFGFSMKFVKTVSLAFALKPTIAPELLMALAVVPPPLSPGPLKVSKL